MNVSICIVAYNEENYLPALLESIVNQTYNSNYIEIVLIDSLSTDKTLSIMQKFKKEHSEYLNVQILENPKKIQAAGWNVAIRNYSTDVMIRLDAHATIPEDFVERNMKNLETEDVSGGQRPCIVERTTPWKSTLLIAENALFGSGIAPFRRETGKHYVKSMFHPAYKRAVLDSVGEFDESLGRTEDNEMSYRIRQAGYKLCYDPEIISYQHVRNNLRKLLKQKFSNGYWIGLTSGYKIGCLSLYHFVPVLFVLGIIITSFALVLGVSWMAILIWSMYGFVNVLMSILAILHKKTKVAFLTLPVLFLSLHVSYGLGTLIGWLYLPIWLSKRR